MTKLLNTLRNVTLGAALLLTSSYAFAEAKTEDAQIQEEMSSFGKQCMKKREDHIQELRELHLKHVNELYDRKLAQAREIGEMWNQIKPGDKEGNKALKKQIKEKQEAFRKEEEKNRLNFRENVLKAKNKEFRETMNKEIKEMKKKHKD